MAPLNASAISSPFSHHTHTSSTTTKAALMITRVSVLFNKLHGFLHIFNWTVPGTTGTSFLIAKVLTLTPYHRRHRWSCTKDLRNACFFRKHLRQALTQKSITWMDHVDIIEVCNLMISSICKYACTGSKLTLVTNHIYDSSALSRCIDNHLRGVNTVCIDNSWTVLKIRIGISPLFATKFLFMGPMTVDSRRIWLILAWSPD